MKKHEMKHVKWCDKCNGEGMVMGLVQRIYCHACLGVRYASYSDDWPLNVSNLSKELYETQQRLARAEALIAKHRMDVIQGPGSESAQQRAYYDNNGRGAGGSNFTGD